MAVRPLLAETHSELQSRTRLCDTPLRYSDAMHIANHFESPLIDSTLEPSASQPRSLFSRVELIASTKLKAGLFPCLLECGSSRFLVSNSSDVGEEA